MGTVHQFINEHSRAEWMRKYPAKFMACRQAHNFPKLIPGQKKFGRTIIELDETNGGRVIRQFCTCGRERYRALNTNGTLGGKSWKYRDPDGYAQPPGYGFTRSDFASAYWPAIVHDWDQSEYDMETAIREPSGDA